jgi:stearoyl-CoA desaturase (Delta-9 desaturase)
MAPNTLDPVTKSTETDPEDKISVRSRLLIKKDENHNESTNFSHFKVSQETSDKVEFIPRIRWPDLIAQVFIHVGAVYGLFYLITFKAVVYTYVWCK